MGLKDISKRLATRLSASAVFSGKSTDYQKLQDECRQKARRVFIHDSTKRTTPGAQLKYSDRIMQVQPDGSLRTIFRLPNPNRMAKMQRLAQKEANNGK